MNTEDLIRDALDEGDDVSYGEGGAEDYFNKYAATNAVMAALKKFPREKRVKRDGTEYEVMIVPVEEGELQRTSCIPRVAEKERDR